MLDEPVNGFKMAVMNGEVITDSFGKNHNLRDKNVKVMIPNMGRFTTDVTSATFRHAGINSEPLPINTFETLTAGRGLTTSKECIPLTLSIGAMAQYQSYNQKHDGITLIFMPTGCGPCRQGQYNVYLKDIIEGKKLVNHGILSLTDEDSYSGLGNEIVIRGFTGITIADVIQNIYNAIEALAVDKKSALELFDKEWEKILVLIDKGTTKEIYNQLKLTASKFNSIKRIHTLDNAVKVVLVGEIYVRNEDFSRKELVQKLLEHNIVIKTAPIGEYLFYSNCLIKEQYKQNLPSLGNRMRFKLGEIIQRKIELKVKNILSKSGFYECESIDIERIINHSKNLIPIQMEGEAILTVGSALADIVHHASGVVSLGPFGCMPSRVAESILNVNMNVNGKAAASGKPFHLRDRGTVNLPFLSVETDGNLFPQIIQSKLEIFILQTTRFHKLLKKSNGKKQSPELAPAPALNNNYKSPEQYHDIHPE
ncbi:MAG: hypothetical protein E4G95_08995 [Bacteroidia bacterium]|nr:MAG: hypothetical protein E4G95_08995 [Bacteroidia bacterium]